MKPKLLMACTEGQLERTEALGSRTGKPHLFTACTALQRPPLGAQEKSWNHGGRPEKAALGSTGWEKNDGSLTQERHKEETGAFSQKKSLKVFLGKKK